MHQLQAGGNELGVADAFEALSDRAGALERRAVRDDGDRTLEELCRDGRRGGDWGPTEGGFKAVESAGDRRVVASLAHHRDA